MHLAALLLSVTLFGPTKSHPVKPHVKITEIQKGRGPAAKAGDHLTVEYVGKLSNGKIFDQSRPGNPFEFNLGAHEVIPGWDLGMVGMKVGGKRKLFIPSSLAYGPQGAGGVIPPNADLTFVVTLDKIGR